MDIDWSVLLSVCTSSITLNLVNFSRPDGKAEASQVTELPQLPCEQVGALSNCFCLLSDTRAQAGMTAHINVLLPETQLRDKKLTRLKRSPSISCQSTDGLMWGLASVKWPYIIKLLNEMGPLAELLLQWVHEAIPSAAALKHASRTGWVVLVSGLLQCWGWRPLFPAPLYPQSFT